MENTQAVSVTAFGETREVECHIYGNRAWSLDRVVVGRFPTGTKLHAVSLDLWKRDQTYVDASGETRTPRPLQGPTAAIIEGEEWVLGTILYIHNSNRGRIVAWNDEKWDKYLGKWN